MPHQDATSRVMEVENAWPLGKYNTTSTFPALARVLPPDSNSLTSTPRNNLDINIDIVPIHPDFPNNVLRISRLVYIPIPAPLSTFVGVVLTNRDHGRPVHTIRSGEMCSLRTLHARPRSHPLRCPVLEFVYRRHWHFICCLVDIPSVRMHFSFQNPPSIPVASCTISLSYPSPRLTVLFSTMRYRDNEEFDNLKYKRKLKMALAYSTALFSLSSVMVVIEVFCLLALQFCDGEDLMSLYWATWTMLQMGAEIAILGIVLALWHQICDIRQPYVLHSHCRFSPCLPWLHPLPRSLFHSHLH